MFLIKVFTLYLLVVYSCSSLDVCPSVCEDETLCALLTKYLHPLEGSPWLRYR